MSIEWDDQSTLLLVKHFHESTSLWNLNHPDYRNRKKRVAALRNIARACGTVRREVERKLKNLSSHYYREKKSYEMRMAAKGPNATEPKWFAYKALSFLQDKYESSKLRRGLEAKGEDGPGEYTISYTEATSSNQDSEQVRNTDNASRRKNKRPGIPFNCTRDEFAAFGEYIALKIRRMDPYTAAAVQHRIQNIIYEADMGAYSPSATSVSGANTTNGNNDNTIDAGSNEHDNTDSIPVTVKCEYSSEGGDPDSDDVVG